jgi:hypothetical protein
MRHPLCGWRSRSFKTMVYLYHSGILERHSTLRTRKYLYSQSIDSDAKLNCLAPFSRARKAGLWMIRLTPLMDGQSWMFKRQHGRHLKTGTADCSFTFITMVERFLNRLQKTRICFVLYNVDARELPQHLEHNRYARVEVRFSADQLNSN